MRMITKPRLVEPSSIEDHQQALLLLARRHTQELALLAQLRGALAAGLELPVLFRRMVEAIAQTVGYPQVGLYLLQGQVLVLYAKAGTEQAITHVPLSAGIIGRVARSGQALLVEDLKSDPDFISGAANLVSEICVPLVDNEQVVGVLKVQHTLALSKADLRLVTSVGEHISLAIGQARLMAAARQRERHYRNVVDNIKEVVFHTNVNERWTFLNPAWTEITGYSIEESLGRSLMDFLHPDDGEISLKTGVALAGGPKEYFRREVRILTKGGELRWVEVFAWPVFDRDGSVIGLSGTLDDITARKMAQSLEQERNRVLEMVATNQPLPAILNQLVRLTERHGSQMWGAAVWLLREGKLHCGAAPGLPPSFVQALNGSPIGSATGSSGTAAYQGAPVLVADIMTSPLWESYQQLGLRYNIRACWAMPIFSKAGQVLGTVTMYYNTPRRPSSADLELLEMSSHLAAIALEQRYLTDQLAYQAQHDSLTGLPNRLLFKERLQQAIYQARRKGDRAALLFLDLDRFKFINDTMGHYAGDVVLQQVALRMKGCISESGTLARMGGDEFTLILTEFKDSEEVAQLAQKLLDTLKEPFELHGHEVQITSSIGISLYPDDGESPRELTSRADGAMYYAKKNGRNNYQFFNEKMDTVSRERLAIELELPKALERGEFFLHYQPRMELDKGNLAGFEALLRWKQPKLGLVPPVKFIPVAEEIGLILEIGRWVLTEACRQNVAWQQAGYGSFKVAVNVTAIQFERSDFVETVAEVLKQTGMVAEWLELELTESLLMQTNQEAASKLEKLRQLGVSLALDDFGTGYSSLSYLQRLPIDILKIDRSFVIELDAPAQLPSASSSAQPKAGGTKDKGAIVLAITTLAHSLGMQVVAEGVETIEQMRFLQRIGCDSVQGYLYSIPLPPEEIEQELKVRQANQSKILACVD